jgi:hypothetical protein
MNLELLIETSCSGVLKSEKLLIKIRNVLANLF